MSLQRSLQKGRKGEASDHSMALPQVGQVTRAAPMTTRNGADQLQQLSMNRTSLSTCVGRTASPFQVRKRMLQR